MTAPTGLLVQRFGFGARAGTLPATRPETWLDGPDLGLAAWPSESSEEARLRMLDQRARLRAVRELPREEFAAKRKEIIAETGTFYTDNFKREIARALDADDGYRERLARFWADHFTTTSRDPFERPRRSAFEAEVIRPNLTQPFAQMLKAATLHPLMIKFLNQDASMGPNSSLGQKRGRGINENLGRELLELHSLGSGYLQQDVRATALLLAGLTVDNQSRMIFSQQRTEPGTQEILGKTYGGARRRLSDLEQLLDDFAAHPQTAAHLASKLAVHFVADTPPQDLVEDLTQVWRASDGDLGKVSVALITHPSAQRPELQKARQPFDFVVAAMRALGVTGAEWMEMKQNFQRANIQLPMRRMSQDWQAAPGPDGWEENIEYWITPQALARRIDWAMRLPARLVKPLPDPRDFVEIALPDVADEMLHQMVARSETQSEGVGLVLASPLFNRR